MSNFLNNTTDLEKILDTLNNGKYVDTADATATAEDIISDKTAYVNGAKIIGTKVDGPTIKVVQELSIPTSSGKFKWTPSSLNNYLMIEIDTNGYQTYNHKIFYPISGIWPSTSTPSLSNSTSYATKIPLFMYASSSYNLVCATYNGTIYCYTAIALSSWVTKVSEVSIG